MKSALTLRYRTVKRDEVYTSSIVGSSMLAAFPIGGVLSGIWQPVHSGDWLAVFIMSVVLAHLMFQLGITFLSYRERPAQLFYLIFMIFYYVIPGLAHICLGVFPFFDQTYSSSDITRAAIAVMVFVFSVSVGCLVVPLKPQTIPPPTSISRLQFCSLALLLVAVSASLKMGLNYFLQFRGDNVALLDPLDNIASTLARQLPFIVFSISLLIMAVTRAKRGYFLAVGSFIPFAIFNSPASIPRALIASYVISAFILLRKMTRAGKALSVFLLVAAQVSIFPLLSAFQRGDIAEFFKQSPIDLLIKNGDFDGMQSTINVVQYADQTGVKMGHNLLSALLFFVPRPFWPEKSIGTGGEAAIFMHYNFINLSAPLPSEFFVDFGFVGVVLGGAIFGYFLSRWDNQVELLRRSGRVFHILPFAGIVGWMFLLLRGSLVGNLGPIVVSFSISWILVRVSSASSVAHASELTLPKRHARLSNASVPDETS